MVLAADQAGKKNDEISKMIRTLRNSVLLAARHGWREDPTPLPRNMPALMRRELAKAIIVLPAPPCLPLRWGTGHPSQSFLPPRRPPTTHTGARTHMEEERLVAFLK